MSSLISFEDWAKLTHDIDVSGMTFKESKPYKKQYWDEVEKPYRQSDEYIADEKARKEAEKKAELRERAAKERKFAKALGLKALKGSTKQKPWGEQLRREFLEAAESEEVLDFAKKNEAAAHAKFWIDNRSTAKSCMESTIVSLVRSTKQTNEVRFCSAEYYEQLAIREEAERKLGINT